MNIFTILSGRRINASFYYRQILPLMAMHRQKLAMPFIDLNDLQTSMERRVYLASYCDINLLYQPTGGTLVRQLEMCRKWKPMRSDGKWRWPPSWVIDTDDNLFHVHPHNPSFALLGIHHIDGTPLKPGDRIMAKGKNGKDEVLWEHGKRSKLTSEGFNILANRERLGTYRNTLRLSDGITTSTKANAEAVAQELGEEHPPIFVSPNMVDPEAYPDVELRDHPDECRILWPASATHYEDIHPLVDPIIKLAKRYKHTTWWFWGAPYKIIVDSLPRRQVKVVPWCDYEEFKPRLACMNHDITIAPLRPHAFNRCRSAIKWYESSIICKPAATVAQSGPVYGSEIQDGKTGMLFYDAHEFYDKMATLIENPKKRRELAANAKDWVIENRHCNKLAPRLFEFYQGLRDAKRRALPVRKNAKAKRVDANGGKAEGRRRGGPQERHRGAQPRG